MIRFIEDGEREKLFFAADVNDDQFQNKMCKNALAMIENE